MQHKAIAKYINPWVFKRERMQQRFDSLRERDGDNCWRCRRPMDFGLPHGHAQAPTIEPLGPCPKGGLGTLDNLCLCHRRCNATAVDNTPEVMERVRLRA